MKRIPDRGLVRDLRRAAGAGLLLVLPPAPCCYDCGAPCCCCWLPGFQNAGPCTCGKSCAHSFHEDELSLWEVECLNRLPPMALPSEILVSAGPFLPPLERRALVKTLEACPLCGDELVDALDNFNGLWMECGNAESQPHAGHFALLVDTL